MTLYAILRFVDDSGATESDDIDFVLLLITLFGGLAIFLLGLDRLTESMRLVAGSRMRSILGALTANRFIGMLTGAGVTAVIQSSSVTTVLVVGFISSGLMTLAQSIGVILGANIGTTVTALLAAIGRSRDALRSAVAHTVFKVVGVLLWIFFIDELARLVTSISPQTSALAGSERLAAETPRQIANAHTLFNVVNALIFLPFVNQLAALMRRIVPYRESEADEAAFGRPRFLDRSLLRTPSLALDGARREIIRLGGRVREMVAVILPAVLAGTEESLAGVGAMDDDVDELHGHIISFLGEVSISRLSDREAAQLIALMETANAFEAIGDIIETNLVTLGHDRIERFVVVSELTTELINRYHRAVLDGLDATLAALEEQSEETARQVVDMKRDLNEIAAEAQDHVNRRLVAADPNRLASYRTEVDIMENLRRIFYWVRRAAKATPQATPDEEA